MTLRSQTEPDGVALALQGGGVHGAFAWGVLDRLLEDGLRVGRVSGVSSGGLIGVALVQGLVKGGPEGARRELRRLWELVAQAGAFGGLSAAPADAGPAGSSAGSIGGAMDRWMSWGTDLGNTLMGHGLETALRLFSPAQFSPSQFNPFNHNPLRAVIAELMDHDALCHKAALPLTVAATDVETGGSVQWGNRAITVEVLLASCCLPFVFQAVEIDGRSYWDGGYSGNPPLAPLLRPRLPPALVLIRAQPGRRAGVPGTPAEILNRVNEIACNTVLEAEIAALPAKLKLFIHDADAALCGLPLSSKFMAGGALISRLFDAGRAAAAVSRAVAAEPV